MNKFERYKQLKEKLNIQYKSIDLSRVMAVELWLIVNDRRLLSLKRIFYFFISLDLKKLKTNKKIFTTLGPFERKDYKELYLNVINKLDENITINDLGIYNRVIRVHPLLCIKITKMILEKLKGEDFSFIQKIIISARFIYYINIIEDLYKVNFDNVSKYIAFSGIHHMENLFTQYLSRKDVQTYSLQHGISYLFEKDIPIDSLCYENFQSDILLCWGQYTVDEYNRYGIAKNRLRVAGYPKSGTCIDMRGQNKYERCLLLLTRAVYEEANFKLLEICEEINRNINFYLKLHPTLSIDHYEKYVSDKKNMTVLSNNETLTYYLDNQKIDFAIAINTSSYYEALIKGIPCLRYNNGSFDQMYGMDDEFESVNKLIEILDKLKAIDINGYREDVRSTLEYTIGLGQDHYKEILFEN